MFLLLLLCLWFGQSQNSAAKSETPASAQQQSAQSEPSAIPQKNAGKSERDSQPNHSDARKWSDTTVMLTILLVGGVFVTAAIYYKQLKKMEEAVRLTGEQSKTMQDQLTA